MIWRCWTAVFLPLSVSVNCRQFFLPIFNKLDVWRTKDRLDFAGKPGSRCRCGNYYGNFFYRCGGTIARSCTSFADNSWSCQRFLTNYEFFWRRIRIEEFLTENYHCGTGPLPKILPDHLMPIGWCFRSPNVSTFSRKFLRNVQTLARNIRFRCYLAFDRKTSAHIPPSQKK